MTTSHVPKAPVLEPTLCKEQEAGGGPDKTAAAGGDAGAAVTIVAAAASARPGSAAAGAASAWLGASQVRQPHHVQYKAAAEPLVAEMQRRLDAAAAAVLNERRAGAPEATVTSLVPPVLSAVTRDELRRYFINTWDLYETMKAAITDPAGWLMIPDSLRRPLMFYLGHTAAFYVNKLVLAGLLPDSERIHPEWEMLFAVGVDPEREEDLNNDYFWAQWPAVQDIWAFRGRVFERMLRYIDALPDGPLPATDRDIAVWTVMMGVEHERIHYETSTVLLRQAPAAIFTKPPGWRYAPARADRPLLANDLLPVPGGRVHLGKPNPTAAADGAGQPSYGWDCEWGADDVDVKPFAVSRYLVSNREFLAFVSDGGYQRRELWDEEGWDYVQRVQRPHPLFWLPADDAEGGFRYRAQWDVIAMPWDWPVDVNQLEAMAFCRWKGPQFRLPSEAEWRRMQGAAATALPVTDVRSDVLFDADRLAATNLNLRYGSSTPVNFFPPNEFGLHDVFGNVWQWTNDTYRALPGFATHPLYEDYSFPCYEPGHTIFMGASWASTGHSASQFGRFAFRRRFHQHSGFRLAKSAE